MDKVKIKKMRVAGSITGKILKETCANAKVGVSLLELDHFAEQKCKEYKVKPGFKGYQGFPNTICTSLNDGVVHGIPTDTKLKKGDVLGIDMGSIYKGVYGDTAYTLIVGDHSPQKHGVKFEINNQKENESDIDNTESAKKKFLFIAQQALYDAIGQATTGSTVGDIGNAIENKIEENGYSVVRELTGHGIGYNLHEELVIPGYGEKGMGPKLEEGDTIAIEVIVNMGGPEIKESEQDGWTITTKDGSISALFEHTVLVSSEPEVLTAWSD